MTTTKHFRDIKVVESDDRFETAEAIPGDQDNIDYIRVSKKFTPDGSIANVAIQAFTDTATPDLRYGIQLAADPATLDRVITALEVIRMEVSDDV